jgi:hypothetical protein
MTNETTGGAAVTETSVRVVAGDRVTWKVRRVARRYRADLGELLYVESVRTGPWLWLYLGGFAIVASILTLLSPPDPVWNSLSIASYWALVGFLMWILAQEKMLVLERGVVLGTFLVGTRPMGIPFHAFDASTLRASYGWGQRHGGNTLLLDAQPFGAANKHHCMWSRYAFTVLGPDPDVVRGTGRWGRAKRTAPLTPGESVPCVVWAFGTVSDARLERSFRALVDAMRAAGVPGVEVAESRGWPPRRLTGTVQDADYLCLPASLRQPDLPEGPA